MAAIDVIRRRLAEGGPVFGAWSTLGSPLPAEILAQLGFDYVCVDLQHGLASLDSAPPAIQGITAAGSVPIVRVPGNEPWLIMRALDLGAFGVVVPLVSTAEQAARAATACRYPPGGVRSWGPVRTAAALGATAEERNERALCVGMIETVEGVANLEAICATPGIDAIYVGPSDLGLSHGLPPGPELDGVIARIAEISRHCGIPAGIHTRSGEAARKAVEGGYVFATISSDRDLLGRAARAELAAALGSEPEGRATTDADLLRAAASYTS